MCCSKQMLAGYRKKSAPEPLGPGLPESLPWPPCVVKAPLWLGEGSSEGSMTRVQAAWVAITTGVCGPGAVTLLVCNPMCWREGLL